MRTTELRGRLAPEIVDPELVLVVCRDLRERPPEQAVKTCAVVADHFQPGVDVGRSNAIGPVKIESRGDDMRTFGGAPNGGATLHFPGRGMVFHMPDPVEEVVVTVMPLGGSVKAAAFDAQGAQVDDGLARQGPGPVEIALSGSGIVRVELRGGNFEVGVVSICWSAAGADPQEPGDATIGSLPVVLGTAVGGGEQEWTAEITQRITTGAGTCMLVRYSPRDPERVWSMARIREWAGTGRQDAGRVGVVQLCGVSAKAAAEAEANAGFALDLLNLITLRGAESPARRDLLEPDRGYTIRVSWQWDGWLKSESQPEPPAAAPANGWKDGPAQSYRFRTAASSTSSGVPPAELTDEQDFDPRSLLRYLIAFEPDTRSAPHLLDDTLLVHLAVDHADQLSALYGRSMQLRLRRTDPPPGSLATAAHPADEPFTLVWVPLFDEFRPEGQRRVLEAIREAPCLEEPNLGGTTGEITADLVPGAWYDLILLATPTGTPNAEEAVISRAHFQASRYRDEAELLEALGFSTGDPAAFIAADAMVAAEVPSGPLSVSDQDLDALLAGAGLDPWPLTDSARTSILWLRDADSWKLAGVLLEAPEAIVRTGRTRLDVAAAHYGSVGLLQRCRNVAGTRVLLTPAAPALVAGADELRISLARTVTGASGSTTTSVVTGRRFAIDVPRSVRMEAGA